MGLASNVKAKKRLGIFDIDGTIFRSSLTVELVNGLFRANILPPKAKAEMEDDYLAWINRQGHYDTYMRQLVKILFTYIRGVSKNDVDVVAKYVIKWQKDRLYRYTRDLVGKLKQDHYFLIAISGSPSFIVTQFAKSMGFDEAFGLEYELKKGKFTGRVPDLSPVDNKKSVLDQFLKDFPLQIDFANSVAVGDTTMDIPLLAMVGRPIAFNPNRELAQYAQAKKWEIVVERKDVMYQIKNFSLL